MANAKPMPFTKDWEKLSGKERIQRFMDNFTKDRENFSVPLFVSKTDLLSTSEEFVPLSIISVETPTPSTAKVVYGWTIPHYYSNGTGNLHGGAAATVFDICTSLALTPISRPGYWMTTGVSRVLSVTYLRPAPVGEKVLIECEVIHTGRKMAATRAVMRRVKDGAALSLCEHDKASTDAPAPKAKI